MMKNLIFAIVASILVSFCLSASCSEKAILKDDYTLSNLATTDVKLAYNGPSSCATLTADANDAIICCYIKLKFDNAEVDEKFTHEGCYEITRGNLPIDVIEQFDNFDFDEHVIKDIEDKFDNANQNQRLTSKKLSVDCSSKYLTLAGFALLFMLL